LKIFHTPRSFIIFILLPKTKLKQVRATRATTKIGLKLASLLKEERIDPTDSEQPL
jgi:hypothetical protein